MNEMTKSNDPRHCVIRWIGSVLIGSAIALYLYCQHAARSAYVDFQRELGEWAAEQASRSGADDALEFHFHDTYYAVNPMWNWIAAGLAIVGVLALLWPRLVDRVVVGG